MCRGPRRARGLGPSVVATGGKPYLGRGTDFVAQYDKEEEARPDWARDTSGSTQVKEVMDRLVIGGHFYAVADQVATVAERAARGRRPEGQSYPQPPFGERDARRYSRLLLPGLTRPVLAAGHTRQLQPVGAARRGIRLHTSGEFTRGSAGWCRTPTRASRLLPHRRGSSTEGSVGASCNAARRRSSTLWGGV